MAQQPQNPKAAKASPPPVPRRNFLIEAAAIALGALVVLVPTASGLAVFLDPLWRRNTLGKFIRVTSLDSLPDDGIPRRFPVIADRVDAWNRSVEPIGVVYLRRQAGQEKLECLTATCPHAGCFVDFDEETNCFKCPCHNSSFQPDGAVIDPSPSPRAMDSLECRVQAQSVLVKFENFYTGKTEKVAKG